MREDVSVWRVKRGLNLYDMGDIDRPVDFICYTPEEFEKAKKRASLVSHAVKEGKIIYPS